MATALSVSKEHITKTPGVCSGRACIAGTRIRVMDVAVQYERFGRSATELADYFTTPLTLADVHAALTYYFDNRDEIEADLRDAREVADRMRAHFPTLREKRGE